MAEVYSLRPYLPVLEPLLLMSPLVQVLSPVLESAPSYAHVVASAGSMGSQSQFPRYACPVAGIDRFKGRRKESSLSDRDGDSTSPWKSSMLFME